MNAADEFTYRRIHHAPPELLFECMTTPEHLAEFWGPAGTTTPAAHIVADVRPGGAFETVIVNETDRNEYVMRAVYVDVERPYLLSWRETGSGMTTTITFTDVGGGMTEVVTHQAHMPAPYLTPEARAGWATSIDRFAAYVERIAADAYRTKDTTNLTNNERTT